MTEYLFQLPKRTSGTLQSRIQEMMVSAIMNHHIQPGSPVPSGRKLAHQLKVSRNTVVLAYQNLIDEGFIESRERSGFYVCKNVLDGYVVTDEKDSVGNKNADLQSKHSWSNRFCVTPSDFQYIKKPENWQQYPYPFLYGQYDKVIFPIPDWRECCRDASSISAIYDWAGDHIDQDNPALIDQIHNKLLPRRGIFSNSDEILVTLGAQHAIFLAAQLLINKDKTVGIENPGYVDARNTFLTLTNKIKGIDIDSEGMVVDSKLDDCDCVYVTPSHQYPTTVTLSESRRRALLDKANDKNFVIIEDDYEAELNYQGRPIPALKSQDTEGRIIYIGSISKTLAPGIRMGFMVAPKAFIDEARVLRRLMLRHPPSNNQFIIARFLQRGYHDSLTRKLSSILQQRSIEMQKQLDKTMPGAAQFSHYGGSSIWVKGPDGLDSKELAAELLKEGVLIEPSGVLFYPEIEKCQYFRLGFSSLVEDKIEAGIKIIVDKIKEIMTKK